MYLLRYRALSKARTQHKDKTSVQLGRLADKVISEYAADDDDTTLLKLREKLGGSPEDLGSIMKEFYGLGDTATDIFRRRMQKDWEELYPYVFFSCHVLNLETYPTPIPPACLTSAEIITH